MSANAASGRGKLLRELALSGALDRPRLLDLSDLRVPWAISRKLVSAVEGTIQVCDREVSIRVGLGERFPYELPHVFIAEPNSLPFIPHVDRNGWVCFLANEGLTLRVSEPQGLIEESLGRAIAVIDDGLSGRNWRDVYDELEAYWLDRSSSIRTGVPLYLNGPRDVREALVSVTRRAGASVYRYVADSFEDVKAFSPAANRDGLRHALVVPLNPTACEERIDPMEFANAGWVRAYVRRHLSDEAHQRLRFIAANRKLFPLVILDIPRPSSGRSMVGLLFGSSRRGCPLTDDTNNDRVEFVSLERRDRDVVMGRGGADRALASHSVAVVGCGAIGGYLATNLATAGVGSIDLVDADRLAVANIHRHALGGGALGKKKADALCRELARRYPYLRVKGLSVPVEDAEESGALVWSRYELVFVAVGDIPTNRWINERLAASETAGIYTWLEPLGLGGHALAAHLPGTHAGCYECLVRDGNGDETLCNSADLAAVNQKFARDLTGCASVFTPYGGLDAMRTAEVAARLGIGVLTGKVEVPRLESWRGDPADFLGQGYRLSERGSKNDVLPESFPNARCPVCGSSDWNP